MIKENDFKNFKFYKCLISDETSCIIFPLYLEFNNATSENNVWTLKNKLKNKGFGFTEFLSKYKSAEKNIENRFLFIYGISENHIKKLIKDLKLQTFILKDKSAFRHICKKTFDDFFDVKLFELKQIDDKFIKELFSAVSCQTTRSDCFELYEVEPPRPSYFHNKVHYIKVL